MQAMHAATLGLYHIKAVCSLHGTFNRRSTALANPSNHSRKGKSITNPRGIFNCLLLNQTLHALSTPHPTNGWGIIATP